VTSQTFAMNLPPSFNQSANVSHVLEYAPGGLPVIREETGSHNRASHKPTSQY
jgi:hypothetical protein